MTVEALPFAPEHASSDELGDWYRLLVEVDGADFPSLPVPPFETYERRMRTPTTSLRTLLHWGVGHAGGLLGTAGATILTGENSELAHLVVRVPTAGRRAGVGTRLLRAVLPAIRGRGCRTVSGHVKAGADGEEWAKALGFRQVLRMTSFRLDVAGTDPTRWQTEPVPGFRLHQWADVAPDDLVEGFARARSAMADQPLGESAYRPPTWTVERVRQFEAEMRKAGQSCRYVVAVDERTGAVAGFTEVAIDPGDESHCRQLDTGVVAEFRGLGLGLAMKSSMMRRLTAELPRLEQVHTETAPENVPMIRVNSRLGYQPEHTEVSVQADVGALEALLDSRTP
ncbi:GNAT family N-acetyltransferase [Streptacidiphilus jiangxiensis]|uniref:Protein N-acetyltransferase, RimJ/RimL family n=1 Tax=Streptacidiphilus jiangxiensis TaxID=235985 RepID=A0A1H7L439_STRJI|nr:GNAT family N-acetyltransferase [Streptacidiphilus jiangxiensis]SEK93761.1 Protein N-acetyltransferase, RimJ/RimL family [Streptacidiphilus jiangxiensis]